MSEIVTYEATDRVAIITLNRPEARNAVNGAVATGLEAAIDRLEADDVWVGVLTANTDGQERPVFCAGADLKAINSGNAASLSTERGGFAGFVYRDRTSRSSLRSTAWPRRAVVRSSWPLISSWRPPDRRSVSPRPNAT